MLPVTTYSICTPSSPFAVCDPMFSSGPSHVPSSCSSLPSMLFTFMPVVLELQRSVNSPTSRTPENFIERWLYPIFYRDSFEALLALAYYY